MDSPAADGWSVLAVFCFGQSYEEEPGIEN
jgi:hypothetical protein